MPDYCAPNVLDSCWSFSIEAGGPVAEIIRPTEGIITSCDPQDIVLSITDSNGVDESTIELVVNGTAYDLTAAELSWSAPTLTFSGGAGFFAHGSTVTVELTSADDLLGNPLSTPLSWSFVVDYEPPDVTGITPPDGVPVDDTSPLISLTATDVPAGVDFNSAVLDVPGYGAFVPTDPALYWIGDILYFDPDSAGITWSGGDTTLLCLALADLPDTAGYCAANDSSYCWLLIISSGGPIANIIEPLEDTYSACSLQSIIITITDTNGIDDATIELLVNGVSYTVGAPELSWTEPTLEWTPDTVWASGPVHIELISADDSLGNALENPLDWWFVMDLEPPYFWGEIPGDGAVIDDPTPDISVRIADTLAGLADSCLWMTLDDTLYYEVGDPGIGWDSELWEFSTEDAGLSFVGGDVVDVCVHACDDPDYCPPNESLFCWSFSVATGGPVATIIEPLDGTVSACSLQQIIVDIADSNGVDSTTIEIEIDGVSFTLPDSRLSWAEPRLTFTPDTVWNDGPITVRLISASDVLGNALEGSPIVWTFTIDLTPPYYASFVPGDGDSTLDWQQPVSAEVFDDILGVDAATLGFTIDGIYRSSGPLIFDISDAGVDWTAPVFSFDPASVDETALGITYPPGDVSGPGVYFPELEIVEITVSAFDNEPDYCDANGSDSSWSFFIPDDDTLGPTIYGFGPDYESTQTDVYLEARIGDPSGVHSAEVIWDDDGEVDTDYEAIVPMDSVPTTYEAGDNSWLWRTTVPVGNFTSPENIYYRVTAYDADYDFLRETDRTVSSADSVCPVLGGPVATYVTPQPGEITACVDQIVIISLTDPDGVDPAPMVLVIGGQTITWPDSRLSYDPVAGELTFDPGADIWTNEQTITVFLTLAEDSLGNPMWDTLEYSFRADLEPPAYANNYPPDWAMIRNTQTEVYVEITDNLAGVRNSEVRMDIYGESYDLSSSALDFNSGILTFYPSAANIEFTAGDTVCATVYAGDNPDLCEPNRSEFEWCFLMEPKITCYEYPNPFTPNGDDINDFAVFDYPLMFSGEAELMVFDVRNRLVYQNKWHGTDNEGNKLRPGLYLYIIKKDGEIVCNGTIVLHR